MHAQPLLPRTAAVTAPPLPAAAPCPHCGLLAGGTSHREDCFPAFQRRIVVQYPALIATVSVDEAEAIERIFWFWTDMIRILRPRTPILAADCVERRWEEVTGYVERRLARHARHRASHAPSAAAAS